VRSMVALAHKRSAAESSAHPDVQGAFGDSFLQVAFGVLPAMTVMGAGLGLVFVPLSSVALTGVRPSDAGVASALLNTTQQIGGAVGVALLNALYTASVARSEEAGTDGLSAHLAGYRLTFAVSTALFAAALVVVVVSTRARRASS